MKIAPIAEIKAHLSAYLKESEKGPIVVTLVLAYSPKFQAILASGRQQIQKTGGIAHEDFWQEMEAEV
jgi:hypothetical protein